jgi:hypothetical protein
MLQLSSERNESVRAGNIKQWLRQKRIKPEKRETPNEEKGKMGGFTKGICYGKYATSKWPRMLVTPRPDRSIHTDLMMDYGSRLWRIS